MIKMSEHKEKKGERIFIRVSKPLKESIKVMSSNSNMSKFIIDCIKDHKTVDYIKDYCLHGLYEIMVNKTKPIEKLTEKEMNVIKEIEVMLNV